MKYPTSIRTGILPLDTTIGRIGFALATISGLTALFLSASATAEEATPPSGPPAPHGAPAQPPETVPTPAAADLLPPAITPGPPITLSQALRQAAEQNLDLAAAEMEVTKARAKLSFAWGLVHPVIQGKLDYTHMDHEDSVDLASEFTPLLQLMGIDLPPGTDLGEPLLANPRDKLTGAVEAMVPLVTPHGWLTIRVGKQGVAVAESAVEQVGRQILLGVAQAYYMAITARDLIDFYHSQIITAKEQLRIAEARFSAGRGMRIDVIRAETDVEKAIQSMRSALLAFDNARDTLGSLIGAEGLPLPGRSPVLDAPARALSELEKEALVSRADIKTEAAKTALAERQLDAAWMKFVPTLTLAARGGYQFTEMADLGSTDRSRWAVMLALTVPIYDYFRYAELDEKRAQLQHASLNLANTKRKATLAVRAAHRDYANALTSVVTAEKQAALADEGLGLVEASYRAGTATSLEVTEARQTHTAAGFNLTTTQLKAQLALLALLDAIGVDLQELVAEPGANTVD